MYKIYIHKPYDYHLENTSSEIVSKIAYDADRLYTIIKRILQSNSDILKCIFIVIALMIYNFKVAISLTIIFSTIYIIIFFLLEKILERNGRILSENNSFLFRLIQEGLGAIKDIIILKKYNFFLIAFLNIE